VDSKRHKSLKDFFISEPIKVENQPEKVKNGFKIPKELDLKALVRAIKKDHTKISKWIHATIKEFIRECRDSPEIEWKMYSFTVPEDVNMEFKECLKKAGFMTSAEFWRFQIRLLKGQYEEMKRGERKNGETH